MKNAIVASSTMWVGSGFARLVQVLNQKLSEQILIAAGGSSLQVGRSLTLGNVVGKAADGRANEALHHVVGVVAEDHGGVEQLGPELRQKGVRLDLSRELVRVFRPAHLREDPHRLDEAV